MKEEPQHEHDWKPLSVIQFVDVTKPDEMLLACSCGYWKKIPAKQE